LPPDETKRSMRREAGGGNDRVPFALKSLASRLREEPIVLEGL
jgi:hypothetical protein